MLLVQVNCFYKGLLCVTAELALAEDPLGLEQDLPRANIYPIFVHVLVTQVSFHVNMNLSLFYQRAKHVSVEQRNGDWFLTSGDFKPERMIPHHSRLVLVILGTDATAFNLHGISLVLLLTHLDPNLVG